MNKTTITYAISIVIAGALVAGAIFYSKGPAAPSQPAASVSPGAAAAENVTLDITADDLIRGNPAAPVTVFNFSDFQCPFCGRHVSETEKQIIDKYVKAGKVKLVFKNFAFLGDESVWAGEAVECAKEQDKFWEMHDYLFSHQNGENQGAFSKENLKKFAAAVGLDMEKFNECLDSGKYEIKVNSSAMDNSKYGVISTPTSIIGKLPIIIPGSVIESIQGGAREYNYDLGNGARLILGAQPMSAFESVIDELLK